jgi:hypothetical protein
MKFVWCWRADRKSRRLDEQEYAEAFRLYGKCMQEVKEFREKSDLPIADANIQERFRPIREWYERLTGVRDCHAAR